MIKNNEMIKNNKNVKASKAIKILKYTLWIYIILCIVIAGLNYGYSAKASPSVAAFITWMWHFYENWIKVFIIIICSFLSIRVINSSELSSMRKRNINGFIIAALVIHIILPLILNNKEIYFFVMPLPWSTTPLQLMYPPSRFYSGHVDIWGLAGISAALVFYIIACIVIAAGTLLFGRRWQCSTLCMLNGFVSEVFSDVFPLVGRKKEIKTVTLKIFSILRWIFLAVALFFTIWWILLVSGVQLPIDHNTISMLEVFKYLIGELLIAMFLWVVMTGRGYCYYCPLGTVLAFLSKLAGQKINTNKTKCVQCGKCNKACQMSIDIKSCAKSGSHVESLRCVGCGHCVDVCPVHTLEYSTNFIEKFKDHFVTEDKKIEEKSHLPV